MYFGLSATLRPPDHVSSLADNVSALATDTGNKKGHTGNGNVIKCLGVFQNTPGVFLNTIGCATLRRAPRGCPGGRAGWLPRCVRTDGRVDVYAKMVPTLADPHTFVQWVLKEEHPHQTFDQWRRHRSDGPSGLSSTSPGHVRATQRSPMSPLQPRVSVGTIHGQNTFS